jgi:hypothetical protein
LTLIDNLGIKLEITNGTDIINTLLIRFDGKITGLVAGINPYDAVNMSQIANKADLSGGKVPEIQLPTRKYVKQITPVHYYWDKDNKKIKRGHDGLELFDLSTYSPLTVICYDVDPPNIKYLIVETNAIFVFRINDLSITQIDNCENIKHKVYSGQLFVLQREVGEVYDTAKVYRFEDDENNSFDKVEYGSTGIEKTAILVSFADGRDQNNAVRLCIMWYSSIHNWQRIIWDSLYGVWEYYEDGAIDLEVYPTPENNDLMFILAVKKTGTVSFYKALCTDTETLTNYILFSIPDTLDTATVCPYMDEEKVFMVSVDDGNGDISLITCKKDISAYVVVGTKADMNSYIVGGNKVSFKKNSSNEIHEISDTYGFETYLLGEGKYTFNITPGDIEITHSLNTLDVVVQFWADGTPDINFLISDQTVNGFVISVPAFSDMKLIVMS